MDRYDGVNDGRFNANCPNFEANRPSRRQEFPKVEGCQNQWRTVGVTWSQPQVAYGGFNGQQHTKHMPFERNAQKVSSPITLAPGVYKCSYLSQIPMQNLPPKQNFRNLATPFLVQQQGGDPFVYGTPPIMTNDRSRSPGLFCSESVSSHGYGQALNSPGGITQNVVQGQLETQSPSSGINMRNTPNLVEANKENDFYGSQNWINHTRKSQKTKGNRDTTPNFTCKDYKNICTYVESQENYDRLFVKNGKTRIGEHLLTHGGAYKIFAGYLNSLNSSLQLNGRHCSQRFTAYKKKYLATQLWANNTGAGLTEQEMGMTLQKKLDVICPCFARMNAVFGSKANVEAFRELNTTSVGTIMVDSGSGSNSEEEHKIMSESCMSQEDMKKRTSKKNNISNPQIHEASSNLPNTTTGSDAGSNRFSKKKNLTNFSKSTFLNMKDSN
ncbi:hypothetical protein O181_085088 [Austropuccinia psidii MF-1]|uniref:Uncharacterized protein n=1 Tax=Austropuccinia psidii MF-1 TaxID=1389203 RepID=A0A9Q3FSH6_9BASI|nr:hypothetical protein [Austropuccinia psidii MF-1]